MSPTYGADGGDGCGGQGVAVGIDTDDGVDDLGQHAQRGSSSKGGMWSTPAWVDPPCGRTVMGHAPSPADKLLIKPTGGTGPAPRIGRRVIGKARPEQRTASLSTSHSAPQGQPASDHQAASEVSQSVKPHDRTDGAISDRGGVAGRGQSAPDHGLRAECGRSAWPQRARYLRQMGAH